jgi:hypothetical protein
MFRACKTFVQLLLSVPPICVAVLVFIVTRKDGLLHLLGEQVIDEQEKHLVSRH